MIYFPGHILDKKGMGAIFKQKDKIANWHTNGGFSAVCKSKRCNCCVYRKSRIYAANRGVASNIAEGETDRVEDTVV